MKGLVFGLLSVVVVSASAAQVAWQSSSTTSQQLCIRDKNGDLGSYTATFSVIDTDSKEVYTQTINVKADEFGCVSFPTSDSNAYGFKDKAGNTLYVAPKQVGEYYWKAVVNGNVAIKGRFLLGGDLSEDNYYYELN